MIKYILAILLAIAAFQSQAPAQSNNKIVGTWKLASAKVTTDKCEVRDSWGPNPLVF